MSGISQFFSELKRRNVLRAGAAYLVFAWLIVQIAETILPVFDFSNDVIRVVIVVLAIGFPLSLVFAWVYEITPEGIKLETDVQRGHSITRHTGQKLDRVIIVALTIAVGYFAVDKFLLDPMRDATLEEAITERVHGDLNPRSSTRVSIAVLPFVNMSDDASNEYFADGISEEVLNLLAGIEQLRVISRTSSFSFKGRNLSVPEIASALDVDHVLEGSVRRSADSVRITAQLIDAQSDAHIWSETYDRELDDIFAIQDEIASNVVTKLTDALVGEVSPTDTTSSDAYALYLQARYLDRQQGAESIQKAESLLKEALGLDSTYAPAWVSLCRVYSNTVLSGLRDFDEGMELATQACEEALNHDPTLAEAYAELGWLASAIDNDMVAAAQFIQRAWDSNPSDRGVRSAAAELLQNLGRSSEAIALREELVAEDPVNPVSHFNLGAAYLFNADYARAGSQYSKVLELSPDFIGGSYAKGLAELMVEDAERALQSFDAESDELWRLKGLALANHALGNSEEADEALRVFIDEVGEDWPSEVAQVLAYRNEVDAAFNWLNNDLAQSGNWAQSRLIPLFHNLGNDPRWPEFLAQLGVSDEQLAEIEFSIQVSE